MAQQAELQTFGFSVWPSRRTPDHNRPHRHNEIELNYVEQGAVTYLHTGSEIRIVSGESAVFWGAVPHQLIHYEPATVINIATIPLEYVLQWDLPQPFLTGLFSGALVRIGQPHLQAYGAAMYRQWDSDHRAGDLRMILLEVRALLYRCALLVQRSEQLPPPDPAAPARVPDKARQMALFIGQHFQQPLRAADVAAAVGLHPHYAMAVFKQVFALTMIDYLTQQRIAYAQQRLLTSDDSVIAVAYDAGFQTTSHFYSAFGRLCGLSPGKYRAALRQRG